ncbi:MAG: tRNA (N6-threonylcarbamoyladenosine(37)-N6)-methyltransferase TrmO [Oscillospiraceae bacterium]|nr:tRNA (N6-threonylcarbamoyladenosine(37)-N6)-methyltransferase TrmO [Oscillospiraceae bacterium]
MEIKPIAYIETDFKEKFGIPRQSGRVSSVGRIVFEPEFRVSEAIRGIEEFSHLWLIFDFSECHREEFSPTVRPPRLGGNKRMGVFASRSPFRPNSLGLSSVRLLSIQKTETEGEVLIVSGADLLSGTPIYDIKPYLPFTDCHSDAVGGYADDFKDYKLSVSFPEKLLLKVEEKKRETLIAILEEDPRPSYQNDAERIYKFRFSNYEIGFKVIDKIVFVISVEKA